MSEEHVGGCMASSVPGAFLPFLSGSTGLSPTHEAAASEPGKQTSCPPPQFLKSPSEPTDLVDLENRVIELNILEQRKGEAFCQLLWRLRHSTERDL